MATNEYLKNEVNKAVEVLRKGGVILYPTDTVWGLGCDATNAEAVEKIYRLKKSDNKNAMLMLVATANDAARYSSKAPAIAWELMEMADKPLTLILPGGCGIASNLIPEEGSIGIRVPDHEFCQALLRRFGKPLVSTSANISGESTPAGFSEISAEIIAGADYVADQAFAKGMSGKPSSIILLGSGGEVEVLRP